MRIGVNGRTFSVDEPRGSVLSSIQLVQALQRHEQVDVTVFGSGKVETHFSGTDVEIKHPQFTPNNQMLGVFWEQTILPSLVESSNVDFLLCPNSDGPMRRVSVPQITKIHDLFGYLGYGPKFYEFLQQVRIPRMIHCSDLVLVPSEYTGDILTRHVETEGIDIDVIPNGISQEFLDDGPGDAISTPDRYILYVGGTDPRKNIDGLVKAYERYRTNRGDDCSLVMVGPQKRFIDGMATDIDAAQEGVEILGFVESAELKYLYRNAQALVFPSLDEGFGLPPIEALACGTPVITSNRRPMTDILNNEVWYVDTTDPSAFAATITEVTTGDYNVEHLAEGRRQYARKYTWDRAAAQTYQALQKLLSKG